MSDPEIAKRNRSARRRGAQWQADIRNYLRGHGLDVEELKLQGAQDEGDLVVRAGKRQRFVIEAKNEATLRLATYLKEAEAEAQHFANHRNLDAANVYPVAVVKARGKGTSEGYVVMDLQTLARVAEALEAAS